jgi:RNA-binding protein PNO1
MVSIANDQDINMGGDASDDDVMLDDSAVQQQANYVQQQQMVNDGSVSAPNFPAVDAQQAAMPMNGESAEYRRVRVPANRYTPLRENWEHMMTPIVKYMKLQIRMNTKNRSVELKTSPATTDPDAIQKAADFIKAFLLGFDLQDSIALLRIEDLYVDSFQVEDVKMLRGDHLARAIGRVAGQDGKTKFAIENATRTRIVVAGHKIHILGSFSNIKIARNAVCALIMGSPPGKVYNRMRGVASRMSERL